MDGEGLGKLTDGKITQTGIELKRAQYGYCADPERSTDMPCPDDEGNQILSILRELTPEYLASALALAKGAAFSDSQGKDASPQVTSGEQRP